MKNKKSVMAFSAILILTFHLWSDVFTGSGLEMFLKATAYIGVDIFFLVSGYSLAKRDILGQETLGADLDKGPENSTWGRYFSFLKARFESVYLRFLVFAVIAFLYFGWSVKRLLKVIFVVELFEKGGGAFLWFLPAIMLYYILFPFFQKWYKKNASQAFFVVIIAWFLIGVAVTRFTEYSAMFIFFNRIPVFLMGVYMAIFQARKREELRENPKEAEQERKETLKVGRERIYIGGTYDDMNINSDIMLDVMLTIIGFILIYFTAYREKIQVPIRDMFYVMVIPATVGISMLISRIPENRVIKAIGSATLEIYAVQMIFGYKVANWLVITTGNKFVSNILVTVIVICIACGFNYLWKMASATIIDVKKR